ncbi:M15 family peptidase [Candidatus Gracilibacteria bacterium]|nr:MAG: M15 family peptidase [Candidatus Gracilibacteria bacterium]
MPSFSKKSLDKLKECHPDLQKIAMEAIKEIDFTILEGHRSLAKQRENVKNGASQTLNSKHCEFPSRAFDFIPYPFKQEDWKNTKKFNDIAEVLLKCAKKLGILARRGSDWNMNGVSTDERFYDGPHFELLSKAEYQRIKNRYGKTIMDDVVNKK